MSSESFGLTVTREAGYRLIAHSDREGAPPLVMEEPPPLGTGDGTTPTEALAAAVGGCLSASLLFCLERARIPVTSVSARVEGTVERNPQGRLRVEGMQVTVRVELEEEGSPRVDRCLDLFQDFCTVKESIRQGIPISVVVEGVGAEIP